MNILMFAINGLIVERDWEENGANPLESALCIPEVLSVALLVPYAALFAADCHPAR